LADRQFGGTMSEKKNMRKMRIQRIVGAREMSTRGLKALANYQS